jgi:ADP-ribosylglycohydrolase
MALDLAESLLNENGVCLQSLANRFAASYRWSRGYGPGAAKVLKRIRRGEPWETASKRVYAGGSFGNGAAMRAPVLALYFARDRNELITATRATSSVTHAHPLGIEGALLIALTAHALLEKRPVREILDIGQRECSTPEMAERLTTVASWIESEANPTPREVALKLGNGITAYASCPTALYVALRHKDNSFETMMNFIIACRGDVDTIGAMAGALWGIVNGAERLPQIRLEASELLEDVALRLFQRHQ